MVEVKKFLEVLQGLEDFHTDTYAKRLQVASKSTKCLDHFSFAGPSGITQDGAKFDGLDCHDEVSILAAASIARCLAKSSDNYGFQSAIDTDKAMDLSKKTIGKLITSMYGDHVNAYLSSKNMSTLQDLQKDSTFFDQYHKILLSSPFDHNALAQNIGRNYTIALLYCYEYLKHGPGFDMTEALSADGEDMQHWIQVFKTWIMQSESDDFKKANPNFDIKRLLSSVGGVMLLDGLPDKNAKEIAEHMKSRIIGDVLKWEITDDINQFTILGQNLWTSWDSATFEYQDAVGQAVNKSRDESNTPPTTGDDTPGTTVTTYFGEGVDQFMSDFWNTHLFKSRAGNRTRSQYYAPMSVGGCFRPGTQVIIETGTKSIEDLREGDRVLTRGGHLQQWGRCSDEIVSQPTQLNGNQILLFGFNDERPFTSANHVFYTTTGPRAIDPAGAKKDNPWLEVGRLRVGHQLLWTSDGKIYEPKVIESFTSEKADCSQIHGVHLREGLRSYHANGYLVHLNYPEITAKSLTHALKALDKSTQAGLLARFSELKPLFERFGGTTIMDAFQAQMNDSFVRRNPLAPLDASPKERAITTGVEHLNRQWQLNDNGSQELASRGIGLPSVAVSEGVVTIDGQYCQSAMAKGRIVAWSREIPDIGWEHGALTLNANMELGQGRIYYSIAFEQFDESQARHFIATPTARTAPPSLVAQNLIKSRKALVLLGGDGSTPMPLAKLGTFSMRELESHSGQSLAMPASTVSDTASFDVGAGEAALTGKSATAETWDMMDTYALAFDQNDWNDQDHSVKNSAQYLDITTALHKDTQLFSCRVPAFDIIRDVLFAQAQQSVSFNAIKDLYTTQKYKDPKTNNTVYELRCNHPELIAHQSDQWNEKEPIFADLTFTKIGLPDIKLPFLFSVMQITVSSDAMDVTGIVRRFDPKMLGEQGKRHRVIGTWTDTPAPQIRTTLANSTVGVSTATDIGTMSTPHTDVSFQLASVAADTVPQIPVDDVAGANELANLDLPRDLQEQTQKLIYNVVLYHMDADDRQNFIGVAQPPVGDTEADQVPAALGPNIEAGMKTWLQEKYIVAWLAQRLSTIGDASKDSFRRQLDNKQRKRLRYWWEGKGTSCMSKDDFYSRLNAQAAEYTLLRLRPRLKAFKTDDHNGSVTDPGRFKLLPTTGLNGGKRWCTALYNRYLHPPTMNDFGANVGMSSPTGFNDLQKIGNIMQALDPIPIAVSGKGWSDDNPPLCMRLTTNVRAWCKKRNLSMPYTGAANDPISQDLYSFLYDAMKQLWINMLEGKQGYGDEVTKKVHDDMQELSKELGADAEWSAAKKAEFTLDILEQTIRLQSALSKANVREGIGNAWAGFRGRAVGAVPVVRAAVDGADIPRLQDDAKKAKVKALAYSGLLLVQIGTYVAFSVIAFKEWDKLKSGDRARLVLGAIQMGVHALHGAGEAYKLILEYKEAMRNAIPAAAAVEEGIDLGVEGQAERQAMFGQENENIDADRPGGGGVNEGAQGIEGEAGVVHEHLNANNPGLVAENIEQPERPAPPPAPKNAPQPEHPQPEHPQPEHPQPEHPQPEHPEPEHPEPEHPQPEHPQPEHPQPEHPQPEHPQPEHPEPEHPEPEHPQPEPEHPQPEPGEPAAAEEGQRRGYNIKGNILRIVMVLLGAAIVVAMCFAVYQNWGSMPDADRVLSIVNIVVQALTAVVEVLYLAADIGVTVAASVMSICAWAGPILAIIGLVLIIVMMIIEATRPPPLTPSEKWMDEKGLKFVNDKLQDPPNPQLTWEVSPTKLSVNSPSQLLTIKATNSSKAAVELTSVTMSITSGSSKSSLFADDAFRKKDDSGSASGLVWLDASSTTLQSKLNLGLVQESPSYGDEHNKEADKMTPYNLSIKGAPFTDPTTKTEKTGTVSLQSGEWLKLSIQGKTGDKFANDFCLQIAENKQDGDIIPETFYISRSG